MARRQVGFNSLSGCGFEYKARFGLWSGAGRGKLGAGRSLREVCDMKLRPSNCWRLDRRVWVYGHVAAMIVAWGGATEAGAVTLALKSLYTSFSLKSCQVVRAHPDGNSYLCPGLAGVQVYFAQGDDRAFISAGVDPARTRAAEQTLKAFNTPFHQGQTPGAVRDDRALFHAKRRAQG
jgi:hypothetical protein